MKVYSIAGPAVIAIGLAIFFLAWVKQRRDWAKRSGYFIYVGVFLLVLDLCVS